MALDEFLADYLLCSAAEHNFQVAIQAALDIGNIILSTQGTDVPREYREVFPKLADAGVLPHDFAQELVNMAKLRNVLVHLYMEVDLERLYGYIQNKLGDFDRFTELIGEYLNNRRIESYLSK
jgi:uncharacterized protein YutE (UPF0331/DUF86 family)